MGVPAPEVEDVTQAALVAAWRSLLDYDLRRPFASWACAIAANKARDWRRHRQRRRLWLDAEPLDSGAAAAVADAGQDPEMAEALRRVAAALDRLPGHLREPLVLTAVSGLSYAEAAQALGISVKAAETRIRRARDQLARLLEPR